MNIEYRITVEPNTSAQSPANTWKYIRLNYMAESIPVISGSCCCSPGVGVGGGRRRDIQRYVGGGGERGRQGKRGGVRGKKSVDIERGREGYRKRDREGKREGERGRKKERKKER